MDNVVLLLNFYMQYFHSTVTGLIPGENWTPVLVDV